MIEKVKKIKRIAMINPQGYVSYPAPLGKTDTGGQITYLFELSKTLGEKGIKVDIITRQFDGKPQEEKIFENVSIIRIPSGPNKFVVKEKIYEHASDFVENFAHYIEKSKKEYSLIHSHYWDGGYIGMSLARILDIPHLFTPHSLGKWKKLEMSIEETPTQKLKPIYRYHVRIAAEQKIISKANAIVLQAESLRIKILQDYLVDFEKLFVIFPGIDTNEFNDKKTKLDSQVELKENSILTISRMVPNKGLDRLIDAANLIKSSVPFHIYMRSNEKNDLKSEEEREYEEKIIDLIKNYHLQDRVTMLGHIPDELLSSYYRKASLLAYPSRYEPFGIVPLEAMACGTPVVVSNIAGCREIIVDGLNGYVVNPHDRKALAAIIKKLLLDSKLRSKIGQNAAFTIKENYTWTKAADQFIALYKSLL